MIQKVEESNKDEDTAAVFLTGRRRSTSYTSIGVSGAGTPDEDRNGRH